MSRVLDSLHDGWPISLVFSTANASASATNVLKLPGTNGFIVPRDYVFHPLMMTAKSNGALTELIVNGGFETAGEGGADVFGTWSESAGNGAIAVETGAGNFHGGAKSAKLTTGADTAVSINQAFAVIEGYTYTLSYWVKGDGATNKSAYAVYDNTGSADIVAKTAITTATNTFQNITVSFTAPADCAEVLVTLHGAATEGAIAYFDDVSVYPTAIPTHTAVFKVASDGTAPSEGLSTWFDDITRENEDDAKFGFYPITGGSEVTVQMITTANYVPTTADIDVTLFGVLVHA